jgi:sugar phosphate permease
MPTAPDPIVWFAALALVAAALGATTLLFVEARIAGVGVAKRTYVAACGTGTVGLVLFALAPDTATAVAGALLVRGIALPTVRIAATILVNRRTPSDARATVHSLLSQSENAGETICGLALAAIASATSSTVTLLASAALVAAAGVIATAARDDPRSEGARRPAAARSRPAADAGRAPERR